MLSGGAMAFAAGSPSSAVTSLASHVPAFERGHARWNNFKVPNNYGHSRWNQFKQVQEWKEENMENPFQAPTSNPGPGNNGGNVGEGGDSPSPPSMLNSPIFGGGQNFSGSDMSGSTSAEGSRGLLFSSSIRVANPSIQIAPVESFELNGWTLPSTGSVTIDIDYPLPVTGDLDFIFSNAEGSPGDGWSFLDVKGELDVEGDVSFHFNFDGVQNLDEAKYYAWQVIEADGGILIDGEQVEGDFVPAEFTGINDFEDGQFAFWQGDNDYIIEYIPDGEQSRYDPDVSGDTSYGFENTIASGFDLSLFQVVSVPEPSSTSLLLLGGFGWLLRRRK